MTIKTLRLTEETKNRLDQLGNKGDTYEDIIKRLIHIQETSNLKGNKYENTKRINE